MEFKKERNFIVAYDNGVMQGKWDIVSGRFIGKSGITVVSCPRAFVYANLPQYSNNDASTLLSGAIRYYRYNLVDCYNHDMGRRFEELLSLGLFPSTETDLQSKTRLTKEVVTFCKEKYNGFYYERRVQDFLMNEKYKTLLEGRPLWFRTVFMRALNKGLPIDYIKTFLNRAEHEHVNAFYNSEWDNSGEVYSLMVKYYERCKEMYGEVKITPNILSNYAHINALYKEYMEAHYDEILARHNDIPCLYFQYGGYEARPILTREAFHEEGEAQHNCVERMYMEKVHNGSTHVVTVRKINAPETSVITCEVDNTGHITQYYAFGNRRPTDPEQIAFKDAYGRHLFNNFKY